MFYCFQTSEGGAFCNEAAKKHMTDETLAKYLMKFFAGKRVGSFGEGIGKRKQYSLSLSLFLSISDRRFLLLLFRKAKFQATTSGCSKTSRQPMMVMMELRLPEIWAKAKWTSLTSQCPNSVCHSTITWSVWKSVNTSRPSSSRLFSTIWSAMPKSASSLAGLCRDKLVMHMWTTDLCHMCSLRWTKEVSVVTKSFLWKCKMHPLWATWETTSITTIDASRLALRMCQWWLIAIRSRTVCSLGAGSLVQQVISLIYFVFTLLLWCEHVRAVAKYNLTGR